MGKTALVGLLPAALAALAATASQATEVRPAFAAGYDAGGDKIVTVTFQSGKTDSIKAHEGLYLGGGVSVFNNDKSFEFQGTLSVKYAGISADNGDVTWIRYPLDALFFYRSKHFRVGGGITYVIHPQIKGTGAASNIGTVTLDNAAGLVFQIDYVVAKVDVGLRLTALDYKVNGNTIKSSGAGLAFAIAF